MKDCLYWKNARKDRKERSYIRTSDTWRSTTQLMNPLRKNGMNEWTSPSCKSLNEERKRLGRSCISRSLARYDIKPQRQGNGRKYVNESQVMNEWGKEWPKKMRQKKLRSNHIKATYLIYSLLNVCTNKVNYFQAIFWFCLNID